MCSPLARRGADDLLTGWLYRFSIPAGVLYRPPDSKLRNLQAKNYLGQARLVAATDPQDAFVTFTGVTKQRAQEQMASQPQPQSQRKGPVSTGLDPLPENTTVQRSITRSASANATGGGSAPQRSNTMAATSSGAGLRRRPSDYSAAITQSKPPPMPPVPEKTQAPFQPVQSLGRKESNTGLPGPAFKPVLGGSKPLDTPPESGNMEASYAEQQDLLNAYADPRDSTERIQDLVFEPPSEDRKPMGQTSDRIRDWAANTSKVAGRGPPPPASSVYPQTPGRNMSLSRKGSAAGSIPPPVPQPLNLRKNRAGQASVEDGADSFGMEGSSIQSWRDVERIRVKLHYNSTIRGMVSLLSDLRNLH